MIVASQYSQSHAYNDWPLKLRHKYTNIFSVEVYMTKTNKNQFTFIDIILYLKPLVAMSYMFSIFV